MQLGAISNTTILCEMMQGFVCDTMCCNTLYAICNYTKHVIAWHSASLSEDGSSVESLAEDFLMRDIVASLA